MTLAAIGRAGSRRAVTPRTPVEDGAWIFILGDMTVFSGFFITYLVYRSRNVGLFNGSSAQLPQVYGVINTLLLLTSSLLVVVGMRAIITSRRP